MNKSELIDSMAESANIPKADAAKALDAFISTISDVLKSGEQIAIAGFGTYKVSERAARKGRNPQTGAEIDIPAAKVPSFKAGKALKDAVN